MRAVFDFVVSMRLSATTRWRHCFFFLPSPFFVFLLNLNSPRKLTLSLAQLKQLAFEALLAEPLMAAVAADVSGGGPAAGAATSSLAAAVRSAALRALAQLLASSSDGGDARRALGLYAQAALAGSGTGGGGTDVVTWQRLGTLVSERERRAFPFLSPVFLCFDASHHLSFH